MNRKKLAVDIALSTLIDLTENSGNEDMRYKSAIAIFNNLHYVDMVDEMTQNTTDAIDAERLRIERMYRKPI